MSPEDIAAAIARAPERVQDPECAYDPNDPAAVDAFWKDAVVHRPGQRQKRMDEALKEWVAAHRPE
jgi:hypothetical protein